MRTNGLANLGVRLACLALGAWLAAGLSDSLRAPLRWLPDAKPRPVRVAVRAAAPVAAAPAAAAPREVLPLKSDTPAPKRKPRPPKPVAPVQPSVVEQPATPEVPPAPVVEMLPLPTLSQPALAVAPRVDTPVLPAVPGSEAPPVPPDGVVSLDAYPEKPGGPVLVLQVTVNDQGVVVDSRILVPSFNALGDLSLALAAKGQRWTSLTPPLAPGEFRRLELRILYNEEGHVPVNSLP